MQYINIHTHIYIYIYITFIYRLLAGQIPSKCRSVVAPAGHPGHLAAGSRVAVLYLMYLGHGVCYYWSILIYIYTYIYIPLLTMSCSYFQELN